MKLLKFEASWCYPCKALEPKLNTVLKSFPDIKLVKIDVDNDRESVRKYNVRSVPCLILLNEKGEEVDSRVGLLTHKELEEFLSQ